MGWPISGGEPGYAKRRRTVQKKSPLAFLHRSSVNKIGDIEKKRKVGRKYRVAITIKSRRPTGRAKKGKKKKKEQQEQIPTDFAQIGGESCERGIYRKKFLKSTSSKKKKCTIKGSVKKGKKKNRRSTQQQ